ncbi:glycosyltransferase [Paenibacillus lactis]|uniref:glycosyltransferase n=1 Tax=Paenibacillus lactis TaxID=228574 RepID=UPI00368E659C
MNEAANLVYGVIGRNKTKNNLLRKTISASHIEVENASVNSDALHSTNGQPLLVHINLNEKASHCKLVLNIIGEVSNCDVILHTYGIENQTRKYSLGSIPGIIVYYLKSPFQINRISIEIKDATLLQFQQMEFIGISYLEYKFSKGKRILDKLIKTTKRQPHLKKRFYEELRSNGLKLALEKAKKKISNNVENQNNIVISKQIFNKQILYSEKKAPPILFVSHDAQNAGASILSLNIVRVLKEVFNRDLIVLLLKGGPLVEDFSKYATLVNLNQDSLSFLENEAEVDKMIKEFRDQGVTLCISNSIVSNILTKLIADNNIEVISLIHELPTSIITYNFTEAAKYVAAYSKYVIFPNSFVEESFQKYFSVSEEKVHIRPQGVYNKRKQELNKGKAKIDLRKKLNIPQDSIVILAGGYGDLRKGYDNFFSIAKEYLWNAVSKGIDKKYHFLWVGQVEPVLKKWIDHDAQILGLHENFHNLEFQENLVPILQGADLFILSSREDPFPSIVLEALDNGTPTIAFENSGGTSELVKKVGVNPPSYLNTKEVCDEINRLLEDQNLYEQISRDGQDLIEREYGFTDYVNYILRLTGEKNAVQSNVSVIIPNYNYENFIEERLNSIIYQTIKPKEIIFLDDKSSDNSVKIAESILKRSGISYKIIVNESNVGCFNQWIRGFQEATGEFIWIAEADDKCRNDLLERLIPLFEDEEVNLAYCQSEIIDEYSQSVDYVYTKYTEDLSPTKWDSPYCLEGREEVVQGLAIKNTIPNASAVLFRKTALEGIDNELKKYQIGGDWLAYLYVLRIGKISFIPEVLNYHRRHSSSIVSRNEQKVQLYLEMISVKMFILDNFQIPRFIMDPFLNHVSNEYKRLGCQGYKSRNILENEILHSKYKELIDKTKENITSVNYLNHKKRILFVAPDLEVGGGQMLVVRLANFFAAFHDVFIYSARPWLTDPMMINMISQSVTILSSSSSPQELREYIDYYKIDVINSHIWWSDKITFQALEGKNSINWVLSMHGCYEALSANQDWDIEFSSMVGSVLDRADQIIFASEKNKKVFETVVVRNLDNKLHKIYYGYKIQNIEKKRRLDLGISDNELVFGIVSRAIKEKGWEASIQAIIEFNKESSQKAHLILVGNGEYARSLKMKYGEFDYIHFIMETRKASEWIGWIKIFDIALLPSFYISESLPNSIIEYLAYQKPVISTNIGEIPTMLYSKKHNKAAGIVLELNENYEIDVSDLLNAMRFMANNPLEYENYKQNTKLLFEQFTMESFASNYFKFF